MVNLIIPIFPIYTRSPAFGESFFFVVHVFRTDRYVEMISSNVSTDVLVVIVWRHCSYSRYPSTNYRALRMDDRCSSASVWRLPKKKKLYNIGTQAKQIEAQKNTFSWPIIFFFKTSRTKKKCTICDTKGIEKTSKMKKKFQKKKKSIVQNAGTSAHHQYASLQQTVSSATEMDLANTEVRRHAVPLTPNPP